MDTAKVHEIASHLKKNSQPTTSRIVELDLSEPVVMVQINGWRLQFIPSEGPFAGKPISRVFVTIDGGLGRIKEICLIRYGRSTHILAGAALHTDAKFGDWDD